MDCLIQRLTQRQTGTLGVIQIQGVHCHDLALQSFIQCLIERSSLPERFMARYHWGVPQGDRTAPRFNIKRIEAIAPRESPDGLWLKLQARWSSGASNQEKIQSSSQEHTSPHWLESLPAVRKDIPSQGGQEFSLDTIHDERSDAAIAQEPGQIHSIEPIVLDLDGFSENETFRVRRSFPYSVDGTGRLSLMHQHPGVKQTIANPHSPSPSQDVPVKAIVNPIRETTPEPPMESIVRADSVKGATSQSIQGVSNLPVRDASMNTDISQYPIPVQSNLTLSSLPIQIGNVLNVTPKPKNNPLIQPSLEQEHSEAIVTTAPFPLAKLPPNSAILQSSSAEQAPLPLAMPKRQQSNDSHDNHSPIFNHHLVEREPSGTLQNKASQSFSAAPGIAPIAPSPPINVEQIAEQVSRRIFRQMKLEQERRGIHP
jgi:hypothetical protein